MRLSILRALILILTFLLLSSSIYAQILSDDLTLAGNNLKQTFDDPGNPNYEKTGSRGNKSSRGISIIWSDTFEGGTFLKWDQTPLATEINIISNGSNNFGGQVTASASVDSPRFVQGWDDNGQTNYLQKTFTDLYNYTKLKLIFLWAEQDIELDEKCKIEIYDKVNGYQTLLEIGSDNNNEDGIEMTDWNIENINLYELSSLGLNEITDWTEIRFRFEWRDVLNSTDEAAADQWFLDDIELWGDKHPLLVSGEVNPSVGTILDDFDFSVIYIDSDNDEPFFVYLELNGTNISMNEVDYDDTTFTDGKDYIYKTKLVSDTSYSFRFWTSDGETVVKTNYFNLPVVNRGPPDKIIVTAESQIITTDDKLQFKAEAFDAHNNPVDFNPLWSVSGGGYITDAGLFTATTIGSWRIYANYTYDSTKVTGYLDITIDPGKLVDLVIQSSITGSTPIVTADDYIHFQVIGIDSDFNEIPLNDYNLEWSYTGGGILYPNGTFDPQLRGFWVIYVNTTVDSKFISADYSFQVIPGTAFKLEIIEPSKPISAGDTFTFIVKAYDSDGNYFTPISTNWTVSGGGEINEFGKYDAKKTGDYWVNVTYVNKNNETIGTSLDFTVSIGPISKVNIIPSNVVLIIGDIVTFRAEVYDNYGNKKSIEPNWSLTGGGEFNSNTGYFTAKTPGEWILYGNYSSKSGTSMIYINEKPLAYIEITPSNPIAVVKEEIQLTATGYDINGEELYIDPIWEVSGGGVINSDGLFTANTVGIFIVYANFSSISSSTILMVNQEHLDLIEVEPAEITINVNEPYRFNATGFARGGSIININPLWTLTGTKTGGTIDENGIFMANESGTWIVYATQDGILGTAQVTVIGNDTPAEDGKKTDDKESFEKFILPIIIIILIIIVLIALYLSIYRVKKKLGRDKEEIEKEKQDYEEEYAQIYGEELPGIFAEKREVEHRPTSAPVSKPGGKVKELKVVRKQMKVKRQKVSATPLEKPPDLVHEAGPMRYGYKAKKPEDGIEVKKPPKLRGTRKIKGDGKKIKKDFRQRGPPRRKTKVEWD